MLRPGFARISLPFFMPDSEVAYVLEALKMVATEGWKLLPQYILNPETGEWRHHTNTVSLVLFSHLCLGLPKGFFPSGFPTKTLYEFLNCAICATCPAHLSHLNLRFLIMLGREYCACSSALCNSLRSPVISSLLAPNIFLSTLFSNTLNMCSSLNVRDKVSQPYNW